MHQDSLVADSLILGLRDTVFTPLVLHEKEGPLHARNN